MSADMETIKKGVLFALGLTFVAIPGMLAWREIEIMQVKSRLSRNILNFAEDGKLVVAEHDVIGDDTKVKIRGTVKNESKYSWRSIELTAQLFDDKNKLLKECSSYLKGSVDAQGEKQFILSCERGCSVSLDNEARKFSRYEIHVSDASSVKMYSDE